MKSNIVLCGFMGCGKSTVGKLLAEKLGFEFCDSDAVIEQREGTAISQIFNLKGEGYFRALESNVIRELSSKSGLVIATGGGAVLNSENAEMLRNSGVVVFLDVSPETVLKRLEGDKTRPLLMRDDKESAVRQLIETRRPFYTAAAHITVDAEDSPQNITEKILELCVKKGLKS